MTLPRLSHADRRTLLLGTALASTLLIATVTAPTPAHAVINCLATVQTGPSPDPIYANVTTDSITCVNTEPRVGDPGGYADAIYLKTDTGPYSIFLNNGGPLTSPTRDGIYAFTDDDFSPIDVINSGPINAYVFGMHIRTDGGAGSGLSDSPVNITNLAAITAGERGIFAATYGNDSPLSIVNAGDINVIGPFSQYGIYGSTYGSRSKLSIVNSAAISGSDSGIFGRTFGVGTNSPLSITNSGPIAVNGGPFNNSYGIATYVGVPNSLTTIINSGPISAISPNYSARGISAFSFYNGNQITIHNSASIAVTGGGIMPLASTPLPIRTPVRSASSTAVASRRPARDAPMAFLR